MKRSTGRTDPADKAFEALVRVPKDKERASTNTSSRIAPLTGAIPGRAAITDSQFEEVLDEFRLLTRLSGEHKHDRVEAVNTKLPADNEARFEMVSFNKENAVRILERLAQARDRMLLLRQVHAVDTLEHTLDSIADLIINLRIETMKTDPTAVLTAWAGGQTFALALTVVDRVLSAAEVRINPRKDGTWITTDVDTRPLHYPCRWWSENPVVVDSSSAGQVVLVNLGAQPIGLMVDAVISVETAVRRPLGTAFRGARGLREAATVTHGKSVPLIDLTSLVSDAAGERA
jgi:hypothetical protein